MKIQNSSSRLIVLTLVLATVSLLEAQVPLEQALWPDGIPGNPVVYKTEKVRKENFRASSLSQSNRVFSQVSKPTYVIIRPSTVKPNGTAVVICPGGGFRDVWFDREGIDLALWLAGKGVTSLVLKYRTFNPDAEGNTLTVDKYYPQVIADARQAIHTLRSEAGKLGLDVRKIGICGFSAGGSLSLRAASGMDDKKYPSYVKFTDNDSKPDFAGLFYPGLDNELISSVAKKETFPPVFIMNGGEDNITPASNCIELYKVLTEKKFSCELHIYSKGGHGFDSGLERGNAISTWRDSFLAWLKDRGFIVE
ncbi:MAG: alpha/beta hydrolase [Bacteroidales bacterium]